MTGEKVQTTWLRGGWLELSEPDSDTFTKWDVDNAGGPLQDALYPDIHSALYNPILPRIL